MLHVFAHKDLDDQSSLINEMEKMYKCDCGLLSLPHSVAPDVECGFVHQRLSQVIT